MTFSSFFVSAVSNPRCATGSASAFLACAVLFTQFTLAENPTQPKTIDEQPITDSDRNHWSFRPLVRPPVPDVKTREWPSTPVDNFILSRLEADSISPVSAADRVTFIRRLSVNLRGLPPSPDEVADFIADSSPAADQHLIDRYLASPEYGERWAQHWLDLARFAETDGFEHDKVRHEAWRYRDWVIEALNEDIPYDRFVALQLAGDELEPNDEQARIATSFCLSGPDMPDINSMDERKHNVLNELTSTIGSTLLGLQMECAQCHDHKYDPISQADFYRFRALFEPAVQLAKNKSLSVLKESTQVALPSYLMIRGDWQRRGPELAAAFPRIANPWNQRFVSSVIPNQTLGRRTALAKWLTRDDHVLTSRVITNRVWQYHFGQGLSRSPSDFGAVGHEPSHPRLLDYLATELVRNEWGLKQLHRRLLTTSVYRLASRAGTPTDASLMTKAISADPDNRLLSRFSRQRCEGESIRDAMLVAADVLNTKRGGPGIRPPLPKELTSTLLRGQWPETPDKSEHDRRSVYIFARRNLRYPIFQVFDRPDGNASCPRRGRSTTAPQSLFMLNSEFSLRCAQRLAGLVIGHASDDLHDQIHLTFQRTLCRAPTAEDVADSMTFLQKQIAMLKNQNRSREDLALPIPMPSGFPTEHAAALTDFCLAIFNANEFIYVE